MIVTIKLFWSTSHPDTSYQVSTHPSSSVQKKQSKIDFQEDGRVGFPTGIILAILDLQITQTSYFL